MGAVQLGYETPYRFIADMLSANYDETVCDNETHYSIICQNRDGQTMPNWEDFLNGVRRRFGERLMEVYSIAGDGVRFVIYISISNIMWLNDLMYEHKIVENYSLSKFPNDAIAFFYEKQEPYKVEKVSKWENVFGYWTTASVTTATVSTSTSSNYSGYWTVQYTSSPRYCGVDPVYDDEKVPYKERKKKQKEEETEYDIEQKKLQKKFHQHNKVQQKQYKYSRGNVGLQARRFR